ncbi:UDP-N-acetylglucosamine 2-epimerase (non-hydrolyzing) [Qipengyuania aquimaris]|uniref:non-hydrolyzing UDP-N-acetylglucosamine 2-epimerase n=1 Tax=Qipengyuania aquimaris TaxID=255984 RepID=UPI001C9488C3|nr:UDP-N-acetylglucosamine 2-epimerase (non-hydrolyzing) [Qipengyuania aquimaris]MBY6127295.1 UDP-N-acetylglucosamine 2-epimerase (non-hydrolyzing) [Qipengyuania aquimaris]
MGSSARILVVFGTRPEAIKLFPLIHALEADPRFEVRVCVSAQHREMLDQVLGLAGIVPDHDLDLMREGQSLDDLTARALTGIGKVLNEECPDWVVVQGDTTTVMAAALAAHYRQIPVCHVEAGLRSGDLSQPWPEEANRRMVAAIASLHCAPTRTSAEALLRENIPSATIHVTGNTVIDALHWVSQRTNAEPSLVSGMTELEQRFAGKRIIGLTSHRRENLGQGMANIAKAVRHVASRDDAAVIFPMHRSPEVRAIMHEQLGGLDNVALIEPLDYLHFTRLLSVCHIVLTDSGGVQEEAPALGKPVLVMRETTERPEGVTAGTARLVGTCPHRIVRETERLLDDPRAHAAMARAHNPYGDGKSAQRICELLAG